MFLSSGDGDVVKLLELPQGCQGPFRGSRRKVGILSRCHSGKGPHLALSGQSPVFSQVSTANLGFILSYDGDLTGPLVGPQESPVCMRVAMCLLGFLCSRCWGRGPYLESRLEPQASSPVMTWISGILWRFHRGVRPPLLWRHATQVSSRAGKALPGFLSG